MDKRGDAGERPKQTWERRSLSHRVLEASRGCKRQERNLPESLQVECGPARAWISDFQPVDQ